MLEFRNIRRRSVIACALTLISLLVTSGVWFKIKPVDLNFKLQGGGSAEVCAKLLNPIIHSKKSSKTFDLNQDNNIKLKISGIRNFNKAKIIVRVANSGGGNPLRLSNIAFRDGRYKLKNLENVKIRGGELKIQDNELIIVPQTDEIVLSFPIKGHAKTNFEFELFIIIMVLSYLIAFKIVDYIADFKTIKNQSRIEILFLVIFFAILFLPMAYIDQGKISKGENKTLAKWKPLITSDGINYNFGKDFDNWYNDRFFLRSFIVKTYSDMKYNLAYQYYETRQGFLNKKNNWMNDTINLGDSSISQAKKDEIIKDIRKLQEFCNKNNIKLYIIIPPRKGEICQKELYPILGNPSKYKETSEVIDYIYDKTGVKVVYPYKELEEYHKNNFAFFKTDHHWTDEAAYLGYLEIMKQVKKDFPNVHINTKDDFNYTYSKKVRVLPKNGFFNGITYKALKLNDNHILDTKYKYYVHKNSDRIVTNFQKDDDNIWHHKYFNNINAPNMMLFGDSFTLNLLPSIVYSFKNTDNIYTYVLGEKTKYDRLNLKRFEKEILENKTDVLIICLSEISRLGFIYRENE